MKKYRAILEVEKDVAGAAGHQLDKTNNLDGQAGDGSDGRPSEIQ